MSRLLARRNATEEVDWELRTGLDGQGAPSYASAVTLSARVVEESNEVVSADGTMIRTTLTLHVPKSEEDVPSEGDRITYDSRTFIVEERSRPKTLRGTVTHTRLRCRDE